MERLEDESLKKHPEKEEELRRWGYVRVMSENNHTPYEKPVKKTSVKKAVKKADLHTHSVQEALNATVGGTWTVASAGTAGSSADVANTTHKLLSSSTGTVGIYSAVEIYFNFTTSESNVNASNDMILPKNTLTFLTVPRGFGNTIYFNYNSTSTTTGAVRIVEV